MKRKHHIARKDHFIDESEYQESGEKKLKTVADSISKEAIVKALDFVDKLKIPNIEKFQSFNERSECPLCKSMRKLYCSKCLVPVSMNEFIPKIRLPIHLTMY